MEKQVEIVRDIRTDKVTLGKLLLDGEEFCQTLEEPWRDNEPDVSCIPAGSYLVVREWSHKFQADLFELKGVPGRSEVKIHSGNTVNDIEGCILLGMRRDESSQAFGGLAAVLSSRVAVGKFMAAMDGVNEFQLTITEA